MVKKGVFFSLDALIATMLILTVLVFLSLSTPKPTSSPQPVYYSSDLVQILSNMKLAEIQDPALKALLNNTNVTDGNRTVMEQLLRYQVEGNTNAASLMMNMTLLSVVPNYYNVGVWSAGFIAPIISSKNQNASDLVSSKELISGIEKDKLIEGVTARAFLSNINERTSGSFTYFGGYEGDGNLTKKVFLPSSISSVNNGYLEANAGGGFKLYINDVYSGYYTQSNSTTGASSWTFNSTVYKRFHAGENKMKLAFNTTNKYIGGGYLRVDYTTSEVSTTSGTEKMYFPGVDGIINLYSSFSIPGKITSMSVYLKYTSNYSLFLTIGNVTIFNQTVSGSNLTVSNSSTQLSAVLNFTQISNLTVPVRLGLVDFTKNTIGSGDTDVVLITDLSGSMDSRLDNDNTGTNRSCSDPLLYDASTKRIALAKCLDKQFIDAILNASGNRVGLSGFYADEGSPYKGRVYEQGLAGNTSLLKGKIDGYQIQGGTCICCALNDAYSLLSTQSNSSRKRYVLMMTDGIPTHTCQTSGGCMGTRTGLLNDEGIWLGSGSGCYGGSDDCAVNDCACGRTNANWSSCRVQSQLNATVYSIGFGPVSSCAMANGTLQDIAKCGKGQYYSSTNATLLASFYQTISQQILNLSYKEQVASASGNFSTTYLYPESYLEINYTPLVPSVEFGKIPVIVESPRFNNTISEIIITIPQTVTVYDAKVTSYSGNTWTDKGLIYNNNAWTTFYNLSTFGSNYQKLGDPYTIYLPVNLIKSGDNTIRIGTGISPSNTTIGSPDNRIIYTVGVPLSINYTGVFEKAEGCLWSLQFEDGTNTSIPAPSTYIGIKTCAYSAGTHCDVQFTTDAIDNALCHLFEQLDFDGNGKLYVKFGPSDLTIDTVSVGKIPFMWGPTVVEVRVWK